jgi:putative transposase
MARLPRLFVPGCSHHVIQRGNNRAACFYAPCDYPFYLSELKASAEQFGVAIHAYVLMTNHVHLLVTPEAAQSCGKMMQSLGRKYVRYINTTYQRSGTLWEGRYKSTLVDSDTYFLVVSRYIELNPVRAGMVRTPEGYPWTSYHANAHGKPIRLLTPHMVYQALGNTPEARQGCYRALFAREIGKVALEEIRECTNKSWALGSDKFKDQIRDAANRPIESQGWGGDRRSRSLTP